MNSDMTALNEKFCTVAAQNPARAVARLDAFYEQHGKQDTPPLLAEINDAALQGGRQLLDNGDYYHAYELATLVDHHLHSNLYNYEMVSGNVLAHYDIAQHLRVDALRGYIASGDKEAKDKAEQIIVDAVDDPLLRGTQLFSLFLQVAVDLKKAKRSETPSHPQYQANEQDLTERALAAQILQANPAMGFCDFLERAPN